MTSKEDLETLFNLLCEREHTNSEHNFWIKLYQKVREDLEILEILHKRIQHDIFGRIWYVPILEERDGVIQDFEREKIWRWMENDK